MTYHPQLLAHWIIPMVGDCRGEAETMIISMIELNRRDSKRPITIYIETPYGINGYSAFSIIDAMQMITNPIKVVVLGAVSDYSLMVLASATKGMRYALPHAEASLSSPAFYSEGKEAEVQVDLAESERMYRRFRSVLSQGFAIPEEEMEKILKEKASFQNAKEMKERGLIDVIIGGE